MVDLRVLLFAATGVAGLAWATTSDSESPVRSAATEVPTAVARAISPRRFHCRVFTTSLDEPVDTRDRSMPVGRWVIDMEARGWQVHDVDFEVGQKPTGFSEGYIQVCLTPISAAGG